MSKTNQTRATCQGWAEMIGVDHRTCARRIKAAGLEPGPDEKYPCADLYAAMTAKQAIEESKARKLEAEAELAEMERDEKKGLLYNADRIRDEFSNRIAIIQKRVENLRKYAHRANPHKPDLATEVLNEAARHILQPLTDDESGS